MTNMNKWNEYKKDVQTTWPPSKGPYFVWLNYSDNSVIKCLDIATFKNQNGENSWSPELYEYGFSDKVTHWRDIDFTSPIDKK